MRRTPRSPLFPYTTLFRSQRPIELGADIVVHSTTKFLNGHSDSIGGAVISNSDEIEMTAPPMESECPLDRKSTRLNSSHLGISYAVFCLKKKKERKNK